ncbi:hypothetical protein BDN70DRAFT_468076 [Pholiota conissans]|uniref:Uncharacterized protein n=1 Tax=Pholiota conissans TaxID=109636 RepID=A0A9P5Z7L9_9AGAR|nr:hypothetical protein BDN70DRAFT_468076 [Pholiota conissans]
MDGYFLFLLLSDSIGFFMTTLICLYIYITYIFMAYILIIIDSYPYLSIISSTSSLHMYSSTVLFLLFNIVMLRAFLIPVMNILLVNIGRE